MILEIPVKYDKPVEAYIEYLKRYTRTKNMTLQEAHSLCLSQEIAKSYGCKKTQIKRLIPSLLKRIDDESLQHTADT